MNEVDEKPIFMRPGHNGGDLVQAAQWTILKEEKGLIEIEAHLPEHLLNPRKQLFGGFTGTYVDMISLYACRTLFDKSAEFTWSATVNMRIDYLAPIVGPRFRMRGEIINDGRSTCLVASTFTDLDNSKLVYALTTLRKNA